MLSMPSSAQVKRDTKLRDILQHLHLTNEQDAMSPTPSKKRVGVGVGVVFLSLLFLAVMPTESAARRRIRGTAATATATPSITSTSSTFSFSDENKRLLRLESASPLSYLYRYRAPKTTSTLQPSPTTPPPQQPRVLLRLNGQSGVIQRRRGDDFDNLNVPVTTPPMTTPTPQESVDYPNQLYLDFDDHSANNFGEYLTPQSSQHFQPSYSIWNGLINTPHDNIATPPPPALDHYNEIPDTIDAGGDNYTIPSLRHYKFPQYKTPTSTTPKPYKPDYLSPYEFFSEEDLENVADLDDDHSKYFVKTKPRDVSSSVANLYNSFYYEPPSYSTKSIPLPVKKVKFPEAGDDLKVNDYNYVVTYPMQATTTPAPQPQSTPSFSFLPFNPTTTTTTTTPTNIFQYEMNYSMSGVSAGDVATAESIALIGLAKANYNEVIPHYDYTTPTTTPPPTTTDATSILGMPGIDYPIFDEIPVTSFDCQKQRYKGFFADIETKCQVWHYCDFADGHSSFLCPNGTLFSQVLLTCDWWFNVNCVQAQQLYVLNERLYRFIKAPKPSFPEDYHGPQVDLWLKKQLELGLLPKIKKKAKFTQTQTPTMLKEKVFTEGTTPPTTMNE